ncbi:hypothetical protein M3995_002634 [Enterococcus faecium]|nr:hypothetical protein [Enterococcus faecium]
MKKNPCTAKIVKLEKENAILLTEENKKVSIPYDYFEVYPVVGETVELYQDNENILAAPKL